MENHELTAQKEIKTTNIDSAKVDDHEINEPAEVSRAMNHYFCSVGKKLRDKIPPQPNPLLSNEYTINENTTNFEFNAIDAANAERALGKMKKSFGFGSNGKPVILSMLLLHNFTISLQYLQLFY